jgi:ATP-dependent helicase/nuclease subunit A
MPMQGQWDDTLAERLAWKNPHAALADVPSKITATQLKGRFVDEEAAQGTETPKPRSAMSFHRPRFAAEEFGLTAAQKGIALHLALQYMDFEKTSTETEIAGEIDRLVTRTLLTPQQGESVEVRKLLAFFTSDLGREVKHSPTLRREFKFSLLIPCSEYYPDVEEEERLLLQGVIDCWFETENGLTVVDFKTDRVTQETLPDRAEKYRPQIMAYSRALEEITGKPVTRRALWFFALNRAVEL